MIINEDFYDVEFDSQLIEGEGIVKTFDSILNELADIIFKILYQMDGILSTSKKKYWIRKYTDYCYKYVYNSNTHKKDVSLSRYNDEHKNNPDWHRICIYVVAPDNQPKCYAAVMTSDSLKQYGIDNADDHDINIFIDSVGCSKMNKSSLIHILAHELTHVVQKIAAEKSISNKTFKDIFNKNDEVYPYVRGFCYLLSSMERAAFINATHHMILNMPNEKVNEIKNKAKENNLKNDDYTQLYIINSLIKYTAVENRYYWFTNIFPMISEQVSAINQNNKKIVLYISYYLKQYIKDRNKNCGDKKPLKDRYKKLTDEFMEKLNNGEIQISDKEFKDIQSSLCKYLTKLFDNYHKQLSQTVYKAYKERLGEYRNKEGEVK